MDSTGSGMLPGNADRNIVIIVLACGTRLAENQCHVLVNA